MRGSAALRTTVTPGGALAGPWVRDELWRRARAVPSLDLRFAERKSLVDASTGARLIDYTGASARYYTDSQGVLRQATLNLLLRSEELDNASWAKIASSVTSNAGSAPSGAATADKLIVDNGQSAGYTSQSTSFVSGTSYTVSCYAKAGEVSDFRFVFESGAFGSNLNAVFNLNTGVVTSFTAASASMQNVGNGWYRCIATATATATASAGVQFRSVHAGNGTNGILLWGAQLEASSSVGEYIPTTSTINSAPRFDHNPTTGESLGLLVEEQRTNLTLNSEDFSFYVLTGTVSTNSATSPANTSTADKLIASNGGLSGQCSQGLTIASGATVTGSVFAKAGGFDRLELVLLSSNNTTPYARATIDPNTGVITNAVSTANGGTNASASVVNYGNGWYRFAITVTYPAVTAAGWRLNLTNSDGSNGDGVKGVFLWGMQFEAGAFPTSYIPTTTATATRSADVASISGSNYTSWANNTQGSLFAFGERLSGAASGTTTVGQMDDGSTNNRYLVGIGAANVATQTFGAAVTSGSQDVSFQATAVTGANRSSFGFALNDCAGSLNGATPLTDTSAALPFNLSTFKIGSNGSLYFNGTIRRLTYWPQRLPSNVLQSITQ